MSCENFFWARTEHNIAKETIKTCVIDVQIMWVSIYRYPITKSSNQTPVIGHPCDPEYQFLKTANKAINSKPVRAWMHSCWPHWKQGVLKNVCCTCVQELSSREPLLPCSIFWQPEQTKCVVYVKPFIVRIYPISPTWLPLFSSLA